MNPSTAHPLAFTPAVVYRGFVVRVIDGDTVRVQLDLGFDVATTVDVRLERLNAPELRGSYSPRGREAKAIVEAFLPPLASIVLLASRRRSFARYVGELSRVEPDGTTTVVADWLRQEAPHLFTEYARGAGHA